MRYILCLLFLLSFGCHRAKERTPPPIYPVKVAIAEQKTVPIFIETLGHVESINSVEIKSRVEGELTGVFFEQGQEVKKGSLLFTIDSKPYEAKVKEAQANLEEQKSNLALAAEKVKRYQILANLEYYSQIDYETLQANMASTAALVEQALAQLELASINLDYCWIYAPVEGRMGILEVDRGNLIGNDSNVLNTLNQMAPIYVTFSIPEYQLPQVQRHIKNGPLKVLAAYDDFQREVFSGKLLVIDNTVDPKTGMIVMRAIFDNENRDLWPGQFVRTRVVLYTLDQAVTIPYQAVQLTQEGPVVFVVKEDGRVEQRPVQLGQRDHDSILVLKGVNSKERVVTEGQLNLHDHAQVEIKL